MLLEGGCLANRGRMIDQPLVDNDGLHSKLEKTQSSFLTAGLHPISVEWFNGPAEYALKLDWAGPDLAREPVSEASLFRPGADERAGAIEPGLAYVAYEGEWKQLPKFSNLPVFKQGVISNFDLQMRPRNTNVGVVFSGYLAVPKDGRYTIWLKSDDGSRLYLDNGPLRLRVLGQGKPPTPRVIIPGQLIPEDQDCRWVESEGVVTAVSEGSGGASLELSTGMGHAYLELRTGSRESLGLLLHSRIKVKGIFQNAADIDGQTVPTLWVQDLMDVTIEEIATEQWLDHPLLSIGSLEETNAPKLSDALVHVSGIVRTNAQKNYLTLEDKSGRIMMDTTQAPPQIGELIEALGWYGSEGTECAAAGWLLPENAGPGHQWGTEPAAAHAGDPGQELEPDGSAARLSGQDAGRHHRPWHEGFCHPGFDRLDLFKLDQSRRARTAKDRGKLGD